MIKTVLKYIVNKYCNLSLKKSTNAKSIVNKNILSKKDLLKIKIGKNIQVIENKLAGNITIEDNAWIFNSTITADSVAKVKIGRYTLIQGGGSQIAAKHNDILIGNFCTLGHNAHIISFNHRTDTYTTMYLDKRIKGGTSVNSNSIGRVEIGHDCTIGFNSFIMPGVKLGNGCIVTPNSTVTTSFEPYSIIAGNPAICIGKRFSAQKIDYLEKLNWYEWEHEKIVKNIDNLLCRVTTKKEFYE